MMNSMIQNAGSNSRTTAARHTRVYVLATLACLGSWMFGYNVGVIGGTIVLPSFHSDFHLPDIGTSEYNTISSNIISMFQLGGLLGSMLTFPATTFCGRTIIMAIASAIYLIGSALQVRLSNKGGVDGLLVLIDIDVQCWHIGDDVCRTIRHRHYRWLYYSSSPTGR